MADDNGGIDVPVPKEMVNDDAYLIIALFAKTGDRVSAGQELAELESSKAAFTVVSPGEGYFHTGHREGEMIGVGERLGTISPGPAAESAPTEEKTAAPDEADPRFSLAAWELFRKSGLSPKLFEGMPHVRKKDVEKALSRRGLSVAHPSGPFEILVEELTKGRMVVLLGGGGHARECVECIEGAELLRIYGIIDTRSAPGSEIAGYSVLGSNEVVDELLASGLRNLVLAYGISGDHAARGRHFRELAAKGCQFPAIIHPRASVNRHAVIGEGVQIMAGAVVGSQAGIGDVCIVNSNAVVSHDCVLGENVHVAPGAILAGGVRVGANTVIGMGATVYMRVRIGERVVVYNGANIFADVPDGTTVRGEWHGTAKQ